MTEQPAAPATTPSTPTDEHPGDLAFSERLDAADESLRAFYGGLGALAELLDPTEQLDPDWLVDMGRRMALSEIRSDVLAARHAVHGAMIGVVKARPQARPFRRPP